MFYQFQPKFQKVSIENIVQSMVFTIQIGSLLLKGIKSRNL